MLAVGQTDFHTLRDSARNVCVKRFWLVVLSFTEA